MPRTRKKVKSIVKTKVISARVTEVVRELLHQQAEDAGMTLSEFAAQIPEKHLAGKGPSMADCFRDKGAGKSNLHRNNGL